MTAASAAAALPAEVTLSTCIGCGAMNLQGDPAHSCSQERKLELVPATELEELTDVTERAEARTGALATAVAALASATHVPDDCAQEAATASAAIADNAPHTQRLRDVLAEPVEPVVSWWCPHCGAIDSPQPCIGVCIRTPVRWVNAERVREMRARASATLARTDRLIDALTLVAHTHPRPGQEARHWRAVRERAARALG